MAFWSKWFGGGSQTASTTPARSEDYKGYLIEAAPYKDGGQWQLAGRISKDGKTHNFVRADKFSDQQEAANIAIAKGRLIVDQSGERMFQN
jgi:hypothetical protein